MPKKRTKNEEAKVIDLMARLQASLAEGTGPIEPPAPGIYENVPMDLYHRWNAVSNSRLTLLNRSPAHLHEAITNPKPSTPAQVLGTVTHAAILEPSRFQKVYVVGPEGDKRTKEVRVAYEALEKQYGEAYVLRPKEMAMCVGVSASIHNHVRAHALLSGPGYNELTLVWRDEETGLTCKARLDRISPLIDGGAIVDGKSTRDARMRPFAKAIYQYGYHRQGAMYVPGARTLGLDVSHYAIIAYEKEAPYPVAVYRLDEGAMDAGDVEVRKLMRLYADCLSKGKWPTTPSYSDLIEDISIPSWAFEMIDGDLEFSE